MKEKNPPAHAEKWVDFFFGHILYVTVIQEKMNQIGQN